MDTKLGSECGSIIVFEFWFTEMKVQQRTQFLSCSLTNKSLSQLSQKVHEGNRTNLHSSELVNWRALEF